ncbi:MAG: opioid growth factor receptor-related protein [Hyphomicrobium sp.]|nr:opioid growth factor receptor-related protein [Hyphomicrobium sp.]
MERGPDSPLVAFLEGRGRDGAGRTIDDVLAMSDGDIEWHHDFIQWLFPLTERSRAQPSAPVLTSDDVERVRLSAGAQTNLVRALERMTAFYRANDHWLRRGDHNHLRITRIIASTRLAGQGEAAQTFHAFVLDRATGRPEAISPETRAFWLSAAGYD